MEARYCPAPVVPTTKHAQTRSGQLLLHRAYQIERGLRAFGAIPETPTTSQKPALLMPKHLYCFHAAGRSKTEICALFCKDAK